LLDQPVKAGNPRDLRLAPDSVVQFLRLLSHAVL
jgi:hypothetical protein